MNNTFLDTNEDGNATAIIIAPDINWVALITYLTVCVFGIVGNIISILVIVVLKEFKNSVLHRYVLQLAIADTIFLFTIPFRVHEQMVGHWSFPTWMCKAKEIALFINYNASVFFLMVMSIDRYIAVCHSFSTKLMKLRKPFSATVIIFIVWFMALICSIPAMRYAEIAGNEPHCFCQFSFLTNSGNDDSFGDCEKYTDKETLRLCQQHKNSSNLQYEQHCRKSLENFENLGNYEGLEDFEDALNLFDYEEEYDDSNLTIDGYDDGVAYECAFFGSPPVWGVFLYTNFVVLYLLPILVMTIAYGLIIRRVYKTKMQSPKRLNGLQRCESVRKSRASFKERSPPKKINRTPNMRKKVTGMCASLVLCFTVCWLPYHAIQLAKLRVIPLTSTKGYICHNLSLAGSIIAYINSALNPYFYNFIGTEFGKRWRNAKSTLGNSAKQKNIPSICKVKVNKNETQSYIKATTITKPNR